MTLKNIALALAAAAMTLTGCGNAERQTDEAMDFLYEYMNLADKADTARISSGRILKWR